MSGALRPQVLIAEDSPTVRSVLKETLEGQNLDLTITENGLDALKHALSHPVDLMILDIDMPIMRGLQVCRFIKEHPGLRVIPVVMLTARGSSVDRFWGEQSGADEYLTKPFQPEELRRVVEAMLARAFGEGGTRSPAVEEARRKLIGQDPLVLAAELYEKKLLETTMFQQLGQISREGRDLKSTVEGILRLVSSFTQPAAAAMVVTRPHESKLYLHLHQSVTKKFALSVREKCLEVMEEPLLGEDTGEPADTTAPVRTSEIILLNESGAPWRSTQHEHDVHTLFSVQGGSGNLIRLMFALAADKPDAFTEEETALVDRLMAQAFAVVELAVHNDQMRNQAIRDGLTNLFNHRHFQEEFDKEFQRAKRYNHHLTVIMLDIDHFKKINDNHGHPAGDEVLQNVSKILRKTVRDIDFVARYGGEEFVVMLPQTDMENAHIVAERIRRNVESHRFYVGNPDPLKVTVSVGMMGTPHPATTSRLDLLAQADEALYYSKQHGRNRTTQWTDLGKPAAGGTP